MYKRQGLPQIMELGTLESYICLTNTLNVGVVQQALVEMCIRDSYYSIHKTTLLTYKNSGHKINGTASPTTNPDVYKRQSMGSSFGGFSGGGAGGGGGGSW